MARWMSARRTVHADPTQLDELLVRDVDDLLVAATGTEPEPPSGDGSFVLDLITPTAGRSVRKRVRVSVGAARRSGPRTMIPLRWHAEPGRHAFPSFEGTVELEPLDRRRAELAIIGRVRPPLGPAGALGDAAGLHHVAEATIIQLVDLLAPELARTAHGAQPPAAPPTPLLRVADVMTPDPIAFDVDLPLKTAARVLLHRDISGAPVVADDGGLVGVLSERDLLDREAGPRYGLGREARRAEQHRQARTVGEACTRPAQTTAPDASLQDAAATMAAHGVGRLIVLDGATIAGVVTRHDVLRALTRSDDEIRAAVDAVLAELDDADLHATVDLGEATVTGTVRLRSEIPSVIGRVERVDGVGTVDADEITFEVDDVGIATPL